MTLNLRSDNDLYGHINNSVYNHFIDSIVNTYLIKYCDMTPPDTPQIGLVVSSWCQYFSSLAYPGMLELGMRVSKLGKSSASYEVGIFGEGNDAPSVVGGYTHVFVDSVSRKSMPLRSEIREGLQRLVNVPHGSKAKL